MRVFCDANVLFSACKPDGAIRRLVLALIDRDAAVSSGFAIREAAANLTLKRPEWLSNWPWLLESISVHDPRAAVAIEGLPEKDLPILQAAVAARCSRLVTGDMRHFGFLMGKSGRGVKVVSPRRLASELLRAGWRI